MARRLVIHNHFARDVGRAVSREEEDRARAASYAATGISRDGNLPPGFSIVPGKYPGQFDLIEAGFGPRGASSNRKELEDLAAGIAQRKASGSASVRELRSRRGRDAGPRYQIKREKRQYDTKFTLVDTKTGEVVRGPTYAVDVPQYMLQIKDQLNGGRSDLHDAQMSGRSAPDYNDIVDENGKVLGTAPLSKVQALKKRLEQETGKTLSLQLHKS